MDEQSKMDAVTSMADALNADDLYNLITSLGTNYDPGNQTQIGPPYARTSQELQDLYRSDSYAARIVDELPKDAIKKSVRVKVLEPGWEGPEDPFRDELDRLAALSCLKQGACWARLLGGAAVVMGVSDGASDNSKPLRAGGRVIFLLPVTRDEIRPLAYEADWMSEDYGKVRLWNCTAKRGDVDVPLVIHRTRMIVIDGEETTPEARKANGGWGDSVLQRATRKVMNLETVEAGMSAAVKDINVGLFKINGLSSMALSEEGKTKLAKRMLIWNLCKSIINMAVIDGATESFEYVARNVSGLGDIHDRLRLALSGAANMPHTRLFGDSPGGLSTDDQAGRWNWSDRVSSEQVLRFVPGLRQIVEAIMLDPSGPTRGKKVRYEISFPPYEEPTEDQRASAREKEANRLATLVDAGIISTKQARKELGLDESAAPEEKEEEPEPVVEDQKPVDKGM